MSVILAYALAVMSFQEPMDGPKKVVHDELLDHLSGSWKLTREIRGTKVDNSAQIDWVLNHQFLRMHMKDVAPTPQYEAMVFIGYDNSSERYVAHWIDVFGGRFSETLGFGTRAGNSIRFIFEYPDGPFHNTFTWNASTESWTMTMEQKNASGVWTPFATDTLRRVRSDR